MAYLNYDLSFVVNKFYGGNVVKSIIISSYSVGGLTELKFHILYILSTTVKHFFVGLMRFFFNDEIVLFYSVNSNT